MGCDIHMYSEVRHKGKWKSLDHYYLDWDDDKYVCAHIYDGRCYDFFGVLAGVRSMNFEPIDDPRGMPEVCCEQIKKEYEIEKEWCHSFSWLTLGELKKYYYEFIDGVIDSKDEWDIGIFEQLEMVIKTLEERLAERYWIYYENNAELEDKTEKFDDLCRIVFWFDS